MAEQLMQIEVVYAEAGQQWLETLAVAPGCRLEEAIAASGLLARFPDIDLARHKVGIFGRPCALDTVLREHDRVEIYRPLLADPKEVRRERSAAGKTMKKGDGRSGYRRPRSAQSES